MTFRRARVFRLAGALFAWCAGMAGVSAASSGAVWYHRDWQTDDGLPAANVTGVVQTRDNYLWLATQSGLARFDGVQFEEVPIPTKGAHLLTRLMIRDQAENLWLAQDRGIVVRFATDRSRVFTAAEGLPDSLALQMVEATNHDIWLAYANRSVVRIDSDNRIHRVTSAEGLPDDGLASLTVDAGGLLWLAKGAQYGFFLDGHFHKAGALPERNPQILGGRDGSLWLCASSQLFNARSNHPPVPVARFDDTATRVKPSVLFEDSSRRLWIGTAANGLFMLDGTNLLKIDTSQDNIRCVTEDREGSIWVGTEGGGLNRLCQKEVELYGREDGLPCETVRSMAEDASENLWVIAQDGALLKLPKGDWSSGQPIDGWAGEQAHCVVADKDGTLWIGTSQHGLFRWRNGQFNNFAVQDGLAGINIRSLLLDRRGGLWIGLESEHLVQRLDHGRFQSFALPADSGAVRTMAEDAAGRIWLGTLDGRLFRADGDKISAVAQPAIVSSRPIRCMSALADGSVWIGYAGSGVCRFQNGTVSHLGRENGLFDGNICALEPDEAGRMWFGSDRGIFYVALAEMNNVAAGSAAGVNSIYFGRDAGLPSLQAYYGYWPGAIVNNRDETCSRPIPALPLSTRSASIPISCRQT